MKKGYIYKIDCIPEKKSYIGQTTDYPNSTMDDSVRLRFLNHLSTARKNRGSRLLCEKLLYHGFKNFTVELIANCNEKELDYFETQYIKIFDTFHPNGYNLTTGGSKGSKYCQESKDLISESQFGNRREPKERKYKDDEGLPKYITCVRNDEKEVIGYLVNNFPVGVNERKYVSKKFMTSFLSLDENLLLAKQCLLDFRVKYSNQLTKLEKKRKGKDDYIMDPIVITLPTEIEEVYKKNTLIGYNVKETGKKFTTHKELYKNMKEALLYKSKLKRQKDSKNFKPVIDPEDTGLSRKDGINLPKNVSLVKVNGETIGYCINNFRFELPYGSIKLVKKKFCSKREPMEDKYNKCITYLHKLKNGELPNNK